MQYEDLRRLLQLACLAAEAVVIQCCTAAFLPNISKAPAAAKQQLFGKYDVQS
jgi:hypothetical protein